MSDTSPGFSDATGVVWDLTGLMPGGPDAAAAAGRAAVSLAEAFADAHRGRLATYRAAELRAALEQLARLHEILGAAHAYASLRFDVDTDSPEHGALLSEIEAVAARIQTLTTFFELEWIAIDDPRAADLLSQPALEPFAHRLQIMRLSKPHRLSELEERILTEKAVTGTEAWRRLLEEQLSTLELSLDGETMGLPRALARMSSDDRDQRRDSADAITAALAPGLRTRAPASATSSALPAMCTPTPTVRCWRSRSTPATLIMASHLCLAT